MKTTMLITGLIFGVSAACQTKNDPATRDVKVSGNRIIKDKTEPECSTASPYGSSHMVGGPVYGCKSGRWVIDEEATRAEQNHVVEEQKHRDDLYWALRTRVISKKEMDEVRLLGIHLILPVEGGTYKESEKMEELNSALLQQFRLRAEKPK